MPPTDSAESDYFEDDDDFIVPSTPCDKPSPSPRPAKRRRVEHDHRDGVSSTDEFSSMNGGDDAAQIPSPRRESSMDFEERQGRSKSRSFVPKRPNTSYQENMFVTQLTQPDSSPERIRGPRWKKPDPVPPPSDPVPLVRENAPQKAPNYYDNDAELRAAIAASLDSFEGESRKMMPNLGTSNKAPQRLGQPANTESHNGSADVSFLDDIPEDAFDSSPSLSPVSRPAQPPPPLPAATRPLNRQPSLRQATLFGMAARNPNIQTSRERGWSPPDKDEPPTQHKLNHDALDTWVYPTNLGNTREYQFNITRAGLFHNLLVALPTGLGKTFIAATIMLNWFRWTKDAQIIFVAPTKPLVSQQVSACLDIAGIPRSKTTMLTGGVAPGIRAEEWQSKRVFFMTPQTLTNDLKTGIADPKRIVLLVVDEAHRATGGYAYVEVVKFLRRYNKSFRVLALTATPGSTVESVQAVIDGLDISRVEIRTEHSIDIRQYVHARNTEIETFENSDEMMFCMDLFSSTLRPLVDQLRTLNAYWGRDPMSLTAYGLTKARQQWMMSDAGRNANFGLKGKVNSIFTVLASLAHAIDLLKYHGIVPFYRHLLHFKGGGDGQKGGKYQKQIVQDESFKKLFSHLEPWSKNPEFIGHPKLEYLKSVILNHFMDAGEGTDSSSSNGNSATRVMIFVHFRDSAEEVARVLKRYEPMIRPHVFVGQSSAKGSDGMDQKTQLQIIEKFKGGTYNTIVATSIGEEGLDIGEVDLIVCYDSSASPIRMLQRMGRTGRKRAGNITLLLMKGKEEESYIKAKDNYEKMQEMIASGARFTFHDDRSARILPAGIRPTSDKRHIDIPPENSQQELPEPKRRGRAPKRPPKKFHMPDDVETGFTRASNIGGDSSREKVKAALPKKRPRTPTPEPVDLPSLEEVFLNPAEQKELEHRYQNIGATSPQYIRFPRTDAFPRLQLDARPTKIVKHGSLTRRMIAALRKMDETSLDCDEYFKQILSQAPPSSSETKHPSMGGSSVKPTPKRRKVSKMQPAPTSHTRAVTAPEADDTYDADILALLSTPDPKPKHNQQAAPLPEDHLDDDFDFALPDPTFVFSSSPKPKPVRKQKRPMIEDSDE
ncbi:hypothetical protein N7510_010705 [Penicillium lagena]|uniref:uncharacterized protein n=1 Tax=Penicillium lagena TaxID=94218 RepID=UPI002541E806|nr:uncharacterized protein N7510_010705 [Penicillium lagena]KAJ5601171.1 hypothetical protein N7510_010705 [Penicillium lagena]